VPVFNRNHTPLIHESGAPAFSGRWTSAALGPCVSTIVPSAPPLGKGKSHGSDTRRDFRGAWLCRALLARRAEVPGPLGVSGTVFHDLQIFVISTQEIVDHVMTNLKEWKVDIAEQCLGHHLHALPELQCAKRQ
jgi:hypothetical protein